MSPEHSLPDLGRQLLGCADAALLDAPLDATARPLDEDVREVLEAIHEAGEASSLRELLRGEPLERWLSAVATPREVALVTAQLRRWLGAEPGEDDPSRLARVPALPGELEAMLTWARPFGLLEELSRPAGEVLLEHPALEASLVECALGRIERRGASVLSASRAKDAARAHLMRAAAEHAALRAREALWARVLPEGPLRALAERLRALLTGTPMSRLHALSFVPACKVSVDVATGASRGVLADREAPITATLFLSGHEQRALAGECSWCSAAPGAAPCLHLRALAGRLLDACLDERDRLHAPLCELVEVPSWKRFLRALSPEETKPTDERLSFRVSVDGERASVGVAVRRMRPDGLLTRGRLLSPRTLSRASASERDRPALELLALSNVRTASFVPADLALLRALVEHPSVHLEGTDEPVRLREAQVHVELTEQPGGLVPEVSLAGAPLAPGARPAGASYLLRQTDDALVFAALTPKLRRLLAALASFRGVLPPESYPALAPWLASIGEVARVTAPKALRGTERPPPARLLLRITPGRDEGVDVALSVRALPMAPLWPPGEGPALAHGLERGAPVFVRRDLERERALAEEVIASLELARHLRLEPFAYRVAETQAALGLLSDAARLTQHVELEWAERARPLRIVSMVRGSDLAISLRKKGQWLGVEGGAAVPGQDLAIGRLLDAARRNERFVPVEGEGYVEIERALFERLERAQLCVTESLREPVMSSAALPFWLERLGEESGAADDATRAWIERARHEEAPPLDPAWSARLRAYQREGVSWLLERSRWAPGVCLADDMGLGKTVQAIALLDARRALGPALVVAPTSVVDNWRSELARFAPQLSARVHRGASKPLSALGPGDVLLTSYDLLLRDRERLEGVAFATQIVDEAQLVKSARTARWKAVASMSAELRVALTGTPVENRLGDLWSLFQLIAPGLLGGWARFRARFAVPIERYADEDRAAALRALVSPFILRRTKRDVAPELPSRTEVVHRVELSQAEQDLYEAAAREARRALAKRRKDDNGRTAQVLAELTRLRQLACHPRLVLDDARLESSKLHALVRLTGDILPRGHRALVFSQFTRHLALVRDALTAAGATCLYLDGSTPAAERARLVERFQAGEAQVFLISLKAGGTGLNLTAADYVVHMDPWWNPAAEDQASDRAHRIGQDKPTTIVRLVAEGTIEEKVLALHGDKRRLAESILAGAHTSTPLDAAALEELLSIA